MKEKVLVLYGGKSVESDISIITALQAMQNLPAEFEFLPVFIDKEGKWWTADNLNDAQIYENFEKLSKNRKQVSLLTGENLLMIKKHNKFVPFVKVELVLNCCHGNIGEDGALAGLLKCNNIAQSACGVTSSALCIDKCFMKDILKANEIASPNYLVVKKDYQAKDLQKLKYPLIVKPANLGSSIGISVCHEKEQLQSALKLAFSFDEKVLIEDLVENLKEFNCACFEYKNNVFVSKVNEVLDKKEIYSFEDKYLNEKVTAKEADKSLAKKIQALTEKVYKLFDCAGVVRVDFLYDTKANKLYVNEINSIPGSLAFYLFKDIKFNDLIASILQEAKRKKVEDEKLIKYYKSDAVKIFSKAKHVKK